jgi:hypothetical protein
VPPPTSTTTKTGAGTGAGTGTGTGTGTPPASTATTPTVTSGGTPVLTKTALQLDAAFHPAAYITTPGLCIVCHGPGVGAQQYPLPPTWAGTNKTPGPYTITPGSDQDHTGRTDSADCFKTGCHTKPA